MGHQRNGVCRALFASEPHFLYSISRRVWPHRLVGSGLPGNRERYFRCVRYSELGFSDCCNRSEWLMLRVGERCLVQDGIGVFKRASRLDRWIALGSVSCCCARNASHLGHLPHYFACNMDVLAHSAARTTSAETKLAFLCPGWRLVGISWTEQSISAGA